MADEEPVLTITVDHEMVELAGLVLFDHGALAIGEEAAPGGRVELRAGMPTLESAQRAAAALNSLDSLNSLEAGGTAEVLLVTPTWVADQRAGLRPAAIGPWWIAAPWHMDEPPEESIELRIDPGAAFGHGSHPTTRLVLEALPPIIGDRADPGFSVLDIGTGTGVLAIAAASIGAAVRGIEVDPVAATCARENVARNGVVDRVTIIESDAANIRWEGERLVVANVTIDVHRTLVDVFGPAQRLLLSGILESQVDELRSLLPAHDVAVSIDEGWALLAAAMP